MRKFQDLDAASETEICAFPRAFLHPSVVTSAAGAEGGLWSSAVAWANGCVKPDRDAHQETPLGEHGKRTTAHVCRARSWPPPCLWQEPRHSNEFKNVDDHAGDESPEDHPVPVDLSRGLLLRMEIWLIVLPGLG
jgi:hypothetical protein